MKKSLLFLSALFLTSAVYAAPTIPGLTAMPATKEEKNAVKKVPTRAANDYVVFTYAEDLWGSYRYDDVEKNDYVYCAFEFTPEAQKPYIGNDITALNITTGTSMAGNNQIRKIRAFVVDDINKFPDVATTADLPAASYTEYSVPLKEKYRITGEKSLYIGYSFMYPTVVSGFLTTDDIPTDAPSCLIAIEKEIDAAPHYTNLAPSVGSLMLSINIEGDNLPEDLGKLKSLSTPSYIPYKDGQVSYSLTYQNLGVNSIYGVTVSTELSNGTITENEVRLSKAIAPHSTATVNVLNVVDNAEGVELLTSKVIKVNGTEVENPNSKITTLNAYNEGFKRISVIEKATGIGCGWCPRGIVSFNCIEQNFPEWILVAIHDEWFGADPMTIPEYNNMINYYFDSNPQAITNRSRMTDLVGNNAKSYQTVYDYFTNYPAYGQIEVTGEVDQDGKKINLEAEVEVSVPVSVPHHVSFIIVEDDLGPYEQHNYFAGGSAGSMSGWEKLGSYVSTRYNDVARNLSSWPGDENSLPAKMIPEEKYSYKTSMSLSRVKHDDFRVVGLITNGLSGEIINAKQVSFKWNDVKAVADEFTDIDISVNGNNIIVSGANRVNVYSLSGASVGTQNLPQGVYVVKADGLTRKVLVK